MANDAPAVPTRSWRPLRVMIAVTLVLIAVQFGFGEVVSASASYPATPTPINSMGDLFSAMSTAAGPILLVHALTGLLLLVVVLGTTMVALRYHKRAVSRSAIASVVSTLVALLGGYVWASSDFSNGLGILLMVNGAVAVYTFLFLALYYTK